jgi:hypothetical protein
VTARRGLGFLGTHFGPEFCTEGFVAEIDISRQLAAHRGEAQELGKLEAARRGLDLITYLRPKFGADRLITETSPEICSRTAAKPSSLENSISLVFSMGPPHRMHGTALIATSSL